jgi:competence protein ComGC
LRKEEGDEIMNQKGTTLIELIIVLVVIMVVGAALVLPNVSIWYPMTY